MLLFLIFHVLLETASSWWPFLAYKNGSSGIGRMNSSQQNHAFCSLIDVVWGTFIHLLRSNSQLRITASSLSTSLGCRSAGAFDGYCAFLLDFTRGRLCCNDVLPCNDSEGWNENILTWHCSSSCIIHLCILLVYFESEAVFELLIHLSLYVFLWNIFFYQP